ncbi:MAG: 3-deoxy-D-manno-octulosonic acid transferase [Verrucomicrobia bacterium]|nr:3-deoxy-D-manno-octulosonic acid transferase [Verrucomicrobiota bacterium]
MPSLTTYCVCGAEGGYREGFGYRFGAFAGLPPKRPGTRRLWIQAVSVGEILALEPLMRRWKDDSGIEIVLTTTTSTGLKLARQRYGGQCLVVGVFPLDFVFISQRAWNNIRPDLILLMESELWPEHLWQSAQRKVPALLLNARMSDKSFKRYLKLRPIAARLLSPLSEILAASEQDGNRFRIITKAKIPVKVCGSLKFDVDFGNPMSSDERLRWLKELGFILEDDCGTRPGRPVILLGSSTWPGEEAMLVRVLQRCKSMGLAVRLLLCPRHAERRNEIKSLLKESSLRWHMRSTSRQADYPCEIYLADTTGELRLLTQLADVVFIGKTLPPHHEGQTPIEAAAFGKPMVTGPKLSNFSDIARHLREVGIAESMPDAASIEDRLVALIKDEQGRATQSANALTWFPGNRGAAGRMMEVIEAYCKS